MVELSAELKALCRDYAERENASVSARHEVVYLAGVGRGQRRTARAAEPVSHSSPPAEVLRPHGKAARAARAEARRREDFERAMGTLIGACMGAAMVPVPPLDAATRARFARALDGAWRDLRRITAAVTEGTPFEGRGRD